MESECRGEHSQDSQEEKGITINPPSSIFPPPSSLLHHYPYFFLPFNFLLHLPHSSFLHPRPSSSTLLPTSSTLQLSAIGPRRRSQLNLLHFHRAEGSSSLSPAAYGVDPPTLTYSSHQFGPPLSAAQLHASDCLVGGDAWVGGWGGWNLAPTGSAGLFIH